MPKLDVTIFLKARGWIAVSFGGMCIWAIGGYFHNDIIIQAGQAGLGIGALLSALLIIFWKKI